MLAVFGFGTQGMAMHDASGAATERALADIARRDRQLGAFVTVAPDHAREQARHDDAMSALGRPRGPLAGMVVGIKDIIDVAGLPTGGGSLTRADAAPAPYDAPVVQRLRAAGAVVVGKTHTVEFAFGGWGTNVSLGTPRNPWDRADHRAPGGSSSGSGVAVAAGLVPAALGTDTGGSVRLPASFCGIVGLKTTIGLLPTTGVLPLSPSFDTIGPMTRTVADAARLLSVLAGDNVARLAGGTEFATDPLAVLKVGVKGMRIGVLLAPEVPLHPDTARVFDETQQLLAELGATLLPVRLPRSLPEYVAALGGIVAAEGYREYRALAEAEPNLIGAPVRRRMLSGRDVSAAWLLDELDRQTQDNARIADLFTRIDALLTPASAAPAPLLSDLDEDSSPAIFTRFVNYLGLAAAVLPMGLSDEGMPVGMQIVAPGFCDVRALRIAAALESARGAFGSMPAPSAT
jgi:aspartyl-tRNA(Asn)/glutamyl-tRNA(Gln) amidotransferase subunit A